MRAQEWSVKTQFVGVMLGMTVVMAVICAAVWRWSGSAWVMLLGAGMVLCALTGSVVLTQILARRLKRFSDDLCETIERMMDADALPPLPRDSEALFDRISQRLLRLHSVQQSQRRRLDEERRALQELPGVGIGLYLAREIVSRQGGYIRLTSVSGEGAAFTIMLPLRES